MQTSSVLSRAASGPKSRPRIYALPAGFSGCAWWRYRRPLSKLIQLGSKLDIVVADNADKSIHMDEIKQHVSQADLISMQAPGAMEAFMLMGFYQAEGRKVVVDYDDYSFDLDPGNPRYAELGTKECDGPGYRWRHGENGFDINANTMRYQGFINCLKRADLVSTTTEYLAAKFRPHNPNVAILPNSIDFDLWRPIPRPQAYDGQIRIGWFGGDSHLVDLEIFKTVLPRVCKKYPQVKIVLQAPPVPFWQQKFGDIPASQLEWHYWADLKLYTLFLASRHWDIGLVPLADNEFNRCKSNIKCLEFAALRVPVIAQRMVPYSNHIKDGETGLLAGTEEEWYEQICRLVEDRARRMELADNGYWDAHKNHNLDMNCRLWEKAYLECLEAK